MKANIIYFWWIFHFLKNFVLLFILIILYLIYFEVYQFQNCSMCYKLCSKVLLRGFTLMWESTLTYRIISAGDAHIRSIELDMESKILFNQQILNRGLTRAVVECQYLSSAGTWRIKSVRSDKNVGNYLITVFSTMESIADNLTKDDLIKHFTSQQFNNAIS